MAKRYRTREGDIFVIDVDERRVAAGHVLLKNIGFPIFAAFFRPLWSRDALPDISLIVNSEIVLIGGTMDARICHGMWRVIGNVKPDMARIPLPLFKVGIGGREVIESFHGQKVRNASRRDLQYYDNRTSYSPMIFETAVKAYHGFGSPPEDMAKLTFEYVVAQSRPSPPSELTARPET